MSSSWIRGLAILALAATQAACAPPAAADTTGVYVNGRELSTNQAQQLVALYHSQLIRGRYWYDARSGAWGLEGRETAGFLMPGYDFGPIAENASNGHTGVFINGRQLPYVEVAQLQAMFGAVYPGRWWLDARGFFGVEGNPLPLGNLVAAIQSRRAASGRARGDNFWCSTTACGNDNGSSGYVDVDGVIVGYDH